MVLPRERGGRRGSGVRPAPLFCMRPTARRRRAVRTGRARAIFPSSPRPANRGRRTMPEARPARTADLAHPAGAGRRRALEGAERRGTNTTLENRCCCCGCSGCSCFGWRSGRCPDCCSRTRPEAHGDEPTGGPTGSCTGDSDYTSDGRRSPCERRIGSAAKSAIYRRMPRNNRENGAARRLRRSRGAPDISDQRWGTNTTLENRGRRSGRSG